MAEPDFNDENPGEEEDGIGKLPNFNVNDEYKPDPLVPRQTCHAVATKVVYDPKQSCIVWHFCLHDNGGVMSDGETPIDGAVIQYRNWLPRPGDKNTPTKSGKTNKHQSKINMLKDFQDAIGVDMSTPEKIAMALSNQEWVGVEADVDVDIEEYAGRVRNIISKVQKSSMY